MWRATVKSKTSGPNTVHTVLPETEEPSTLVRKLLDAFVSLLIRLLGTAAVLVVMVPAVLFLGFIGGSSTAQQLILLTWLIGFVGIAWSLGSFVRLSMVTAAASLLVWASLGIYASTFGAASARGYPLPMWGAASLALVIPALVRPPAWLLALMESRRSSRR